MKTFREFNEIMATDYSCDNYKDAEAIALSLGGTGAHEVNNRYYPGLTPNDYVALLYSARRVRLVGATE